MTTELENQKTESQVKLEAESTRLQTEIDNLQMVYATDTHHTELMIKIIQ